MKKDGQVKLGSTPCDLCSNPGTVEVGKHIYCTTHAPRPNEKRSSDDETFKTAHERLTELH